jgi:hypothetical protein
MIIIHRASKPVKNSLASLFCRAARQEGRTLDQIKEMYDRTAAQGYWGEWGQFVLRAKQSMRGHVDAKEIEAAEFKVR